MLVIRKAPISTAFVSERCICQRFAQTRSATATCPYSAYFHVEQVVDRCHFTCVRVHDLCVDDEPSVGDRHVVIRVAGVEVGLDYAVPYFVEEWDGLQWQEIERAATRDALRAMGMRAAEDRDDAAVREPTAYRVAAVKRHPIVTRTEHGIRR